MYATPPSSPSIISPTRTHLDRLAPNQLLTAAQSPRATYTKRMLQTCPASCHPYHTARRLLASNHSQSCLMHTTARRDPRFSLLAACCERTLAISCMYNIFRICPATDWARLLHFPDTALHASDAPWAPWSADSARRQAACMIGRLINGMRGTADCVEMLSNETCTCATSKHPCA